MDEFEKVEKLRQRANVTYEEAKKALDSANGDLLDAMILLENEGKVTRDMNQTHSTTYEAQKGYISVADTVADQKERGRAPIRNRIREFAAKVGRFLRDNSFHVEREGKEIISLPAWILAIAILAAFWAVAILLVVALFFGCKYSIVGPDDMRAVNEAMDKASELADRIKEEFDNAGSKDE